MSANHAHYLRMMESAAQIQSHIAEILHVKAAEAERSKNWLCSRLDNEFDFEGSLGFHEQIVEMIDGITKTQSGMNRNLKALIGTNERGQFDFSDFFNSSGNDD